MAMRTPLPCPDPAISAAIRQLEDAIQTFGDRADASTLAYRCAFLVSTVRRCLVASARTNLHCELRLAADVEDFERRWSNSAVIGGHFDLFERDSRRFLRVLRQRLGTQPGSAQWSAA